MVLAVIIVIVVGIVNFFYLKPPVVNWDEGTHALWGFKEWLALHNGQIGDFLTIARQQFSYPPLGSWFIALTNLPAEFSLNLARFSSTLGFIVGGIFLLLIARILTSSLPSPNRRGDTRGEVFSLFLFLTSPAILFYCVTVFKESWGMALTLLTFYFYFKAISSRHAEFIPEFHSGPSVSASKQNINKILKLVQDDIYYLCTGLALTLLFLEKYNYASLVGLTLALEAVVETIFNGTNLVNWVNWLKRQLVLFLPLIFFASWWILTPDNKLPQFLDIMRSDWNPVTVGVGNSWQYLTFFIQSIRVSYTFSDVLFLLIVICFLLSIKDLWQKKIRVLWVFFTLNFVLATLHAINLQDRYIYTSVPALFLLVGYELSWVAGPASRFLGRSFYILFVLLVILVLFDLRNFPQLLKSNATHMLLSPLYNESDYHDTLFNFNKNDWPKQSENRPHPNLLLRGEGIPGFPLLAGEGEGEVDSPEGVIDYILTNVDITKPINYLGWTAEISPDWVELRRQLKLRRCMANGIQCTVNNKELLVTIEVKPTSREYTYDYKRANSWQLPKIKEMTQTNADKLVTEKDFQELGVKVRIYGQ